MEDSGVTRAEALKLSPLLFLYCTGCVGISALSLSSFASIIQEYLTVRYDFTMELVMVVGQVFFQWLFMLRSPWSDRYRYMVLALTVSMIGGVMLWPLLLFNLWLLVPPPVAVTYFFGVVSAIFVIHFFAIREKNLPDRLTVTWVFYRLLLLIFVTL